MQRSLLTAGVCLLAAPALALEGVYQMERDGVTIEITITEAQAHHEAVVAVPEAEDVPDEVIVLRRDGDMLESAQTADGPFDPFGRVTDSGAIMVADAMSDAEFRAERIEEAP